MHLDFAEPHVLEKDGEYRIIGLRLTEEHDPDCVWTYDFEEHVGADRPDIDESTVCVDLLRYARDMEFWDDGMSAVEPVPCPRIDPSSPSL